MGRGSSWAEAGAVEGSEACIWPQSGGLGAGQAVWGCFRCVWGCFRHLQRRASGVVGVVGRGQGSSVVGPGQLRARSGRHRWAVGTSAGAIRVGGGRPPVGRRKSETPRAGRAGVSEFYTGARFASVASRGSPLWGREGLRWNGTPEQKETRGPESGTSS